MVQFDEHIFQMDSNFPCNCVTPPKFNSSPLKSYRNPIGEDRLPTIHLCRGKLAVKLRGCIKSTDENAKQKRHVVAPEDDNFALVIRRLLIENYFT